MSSRLDCIKDWEALARKANYLVSNLAHQSQMSERQLRRYFLLSFGITPSKWLDDLRMRDAQSLLSKGESIKVIALQLSFADAPHFCRAFKRVYGLSPRAFFFLQAQADRKNVRLRP